MDIRASMSMQAFSEQAHKKEEKIKKISAKDIARLSIKASYERDKWRRDNISSKEFSLVDLPIGSVAVFSSSEIEIKAALDDQPIVVDLNKKKLGQSLIGYTPKVIVIQGAGHYNAQRLSGKKIVKAWVGTEALKILQIHCDDQFGSNELNSKLSEQLREKFTPKKKGQDKGIYNPQPWINEIYPYEDYFIYSYEGKLYRQNYSCDSKKRTVKLIDEPTEVVQKYADIESVGIRSETGMSNHILQKPMGNQPKTLAGRYLYNGTAPGTGVGPRVKIKAPPKSLVAKEMNSSRQRIFKSK